MPIQVLSPLLTNQIAAGEVVERPASVVKELIENSLDAEATLIEIDIERGGAKCIRVRDNGNGINKDELLLALVSHATSKITNLDDLETITSMGFRGEALASVSAVSRLILTSRTVSQSEAWQVYAEGCSLAVTLKPIAHPVGTTVEVLDLFYNRPARRKFMRTEKTEFIHIDEIIRRAALARFDVTFILQHNGKIIRQYYAVSQSNQHFRRLRAICGSAFVKLALNIFFQHDDLAIHGWVVDSPNNKSPEIQYSYVNRRPIRDKLINHAIRQAYQEHLSRMLQPSFVLFIDINPNQVDINVHPAKHEVRFHQARLVHDFIYQAVTGVLQQRRTPVPVMDEERWCILENNQVSRHSNFAQLFGNWRCYGSTQHTDGKILPSSDKLSVPWYPLSGAIDIDDRHQKKKFDIDEKNDIHPEITGWNTVLLNQHSVLAKLSLTDRGGYVGHWDSKYQDRDIYRQSIQMLPLSREKQMVQRDIFAKRSTVDGWSLIDTVSLSANANNTDSVSACIRSANVSVEEGLVGNLYTFGLVLTLVPPCYALVESAGCLALISLSVARRCLVEYELTPKNKTLHAHPLLIPLQMTLHEPEIMALKRHQLILQEMGIMLQVYLHQVTLSAVPLPLHQQDLRNLITDLLIYIKDYTLVTHHQIAVWLSRRLQHESIAWSRSRAIQLLADVERLCPQLVKAPPDGLLVTLNFEFAIEALNND